MKILLITLLLFMSSEIALANLCEAPLFGPEQFKIPLTQDYFNFLTKHWKTSSIKDLNGRLDEIDYARPKEVAFWMTDMPTRRTDEPISPAAFAKVEKITDGIYYGFLQEIRTYHLHRLPRSRLFKKFSDHVSVVPNSNLAPALVHIHLRLYSRLAIHKYVEDLLIHTFQYMQKSPSAEIRKKAQDGIIDHDTIVAFLKLRVQQRGLKTIDINETRQLYDGEFRSRVRQGIPIDVGFQFEKKSTYVGSEHGVYTHLIQFDMISDLLVHYSKLLNTTPQVFFDYFGTKQGNDYWLAAFDGSGTTESDVGFNNPFNVAKLAIDLNLRTQRELEVSGYAQMLQESEAQKQP